MSEPPSISELMRRLDDLTRRVEDLIRTQEDRFVSRREFDLRVGELEKDIDTQASFRRQILAGALVGLFLLLANIIVSLLRLPGVTS